MNFKHIYHWGWGRVVQWFKCLTCKHEDQSLDSQNPCEMLGGSGNPLIIPLLGRQRQGIPKTNWLRRQTPSAKSGG